MTKRLTSTFIQGGFPAIMTIYYRYEFMGFEIPVTFAKTYSIDADFTGEYIKHLTKHLLK